MDNLHLFKSFEANRLLYRGAEKPRGAASSGKETMSPQELREAAKSHLAESARYLKSIGEDLGVKIDPLDHHADYKGKGKVDAHMNAVILTVVRNIWLLNKALKRNKVTAKLLTESRSSMKLADTHYDSGKNPNDVVDIRSADLIERHLIVPKKGASAKKKVSSKPELLKKRNLDENEAARLYDKFIDYVKGEVNFYTRAEKNPKNTKRVEAAFVAAGGDPKQTVTYGRASTGMAKASNVLMHGNDKRGDFGHLDYIYEKLNEVNDQNHLQALVEMSGYTNYNTFTRWLIRLNDRAKEARRAYNEA